MKKKLVAMLLSFSMAATMLAGCGSQDDGKESQDSAVSGSTAQEAESQTTEQESGEQTFDKKLQITMWSTNGSDYIASEVPTENIVLDWLEEQTNVELENIVGNGGGSADSKMIQFLAADALPEVLYCEAAQVQALANGGRLYELSDELLQEYAPNLYAQMPDFVRNDDNIDGKNYSIPANIANNTSVDPTMTEEAASYLYAPYSTRTAQGYNGLWIRDDVLQMIYPDAMSYDDCVALLEQENRPIGELLLDVPIYSSEDYINLFYQIAELNLKEGDRPVYVYGFNGADNWQALAVLGPELMGFRNHNYTGNWNFETQEIEVLLDTDLMKDTAKMLTDMVREGVIEEESLIHTQAQFDAKVANGLYAIINGGANNIANVNQGLLDAGKTYQYRPLFGDFDNMEQYAAYTEPFYARRHICITDSVKEEDLPQILNWLDTQFTEEFKSVFYWGPEEAGLYVENADGTRTYTDKAMQNYFLENNSEGHTLADMKGLGNSSCTIYASYTATVGANYIPMVYNDCITYKPTAKSGFAFSVSSEYVTNVQAAPNSAGWASQYADIPEVMTFWETRTQWEDPFKLVFATKTDAEFEEKWQAAVDNFHSLVDVESMEEKMTEVAREECKILGIEIK